MKTVSKLFRFTFRDGTFYVEGESMERAIEAWRAHMATRDDYEFMADDEPETCTLVHATPVIRRETANQ
jgi:hypothetical protein